MRKSFYKRFIHNMKSRWAHISKARRFHKVLDNPAGTKMRDRSLKTSRRGCDGTMR